MLAQRLAITGLALMFLIVVLSLGGDVSLLINLKSAFLVLGGSLVSVLLAYPRRTLKGLARSLGSLINTPETDKRQLLAEMQRLARLSRIRGPRELEEETNNLANPFLRHGMELILEGYDRFEIRGVMEKEFDLFFSKKESEIQVLNALAKLAPAFGFVGTILGLVNVLGHMGQPEEIGQGMAVALLTTFHGLLFSNFLFLPLSRSLSERRKEEARILGVILEGIMDISERKSPRSIFYRLQTYLDVEGETEANDVAPVDELEMAPLGIPLGELLEKRGV